MFGENKNIKSLGHYKRQMRILNKPLLTLIKKDIWPLTNATLKRKAVSLIEEIQSAVACLGLLNKSSEALRYVEYFSFSLANRLLSIESAHTKYPRKTPHIDKTIIKDACDFGTFFSLISLTHPKAMRANPNLKVKYIEIPKRNTSEIKVLEVFNILDRILQLQILAFLDPLIDALLPENFYGFREGRSPLQAIAYLSENIQHSDISKYHLVSINTQKCFDSVSHKFILDKFPFPLKYKNLLIRWLR